MIGLVLAAGAGRRLAPLTDDLPKTLLPVQGERPLLDLTIHNMASVGLTDVAIITGFAEHRIRDVVPDLQERHGVTIELVHNDHALDRNNAYSLWCARALIRQGVLLCNGDTMHPASVEEDLLAARGPALLLAVDRAKHLGHEEMKIALDSAGTVARISKKLPVAEADGEYIGLTLIEPLIAEPLVEALETVWRRDPQLYYEDGYQALVNRGHPVDVHPIDTADWVEIDDHADLARARELACRY